MTKPSLHSSPILCGQATSPLCGPVSLPVTWELKHLYHRAAVKVRGKIKHLAQYFTSTCSTVGTLLLLRQYHIARIDFLVLGKVVFWINQRFTSFQSMGKNYLLQVSYLFGHAFSLTPKPPATRLLWHLIFDPGLDCGLETINVGQSSHLPITKTHYFLPSACGTVPYYGMWATLSRLPQSSSL